MQEAERLDRAVDKFATAMKKRLAEKAKQGYKGWDDPSYKDVILKKLTKHTVSLLEDDIVEKDIDSINAVDIANLSMMLYFFRKGLCLWQ